MAEADDHPHGELTDEQRHDAAAQDLNILAALMLVGSATFAIVNYVVGTVGWLGAVLTVSSTAAWSIGLWRRSSPIAAFVKIGFGFGGLLSPIVGIAGLVFGLVGQPWGWAMLTGALAYFLFSVLGLSIIERAYDEGVLEPV